MSETLNALGDVDRIFVFHGDKTPPDFEFPDYETIYVEWPETEMYRTFYPLLGQPFQGKTGKPSDVPAITDKSLLIVDEMMMTRRRNDLKYNCTHHYLRVSERRIVFNWLPFIEDESDFMILMDYAYPDKYRRQPFRTEYLSNASGYRRIPEISSVHVPVTERDKANYEKKKEKLFEDVEKNPSRDPNIVPRNLALLAGTAKAQKLKDDQIGVARNHRFRADNIVTYADTVTDYDVFVIDPAMRRRNLIDFLRRSNVTSLCYMSTDLPVDKYYLEDLVDWVERLEEISDAADLH